MAKILLMATFVLFLPGTCFNYQIVTHTQISDLAVKLSALKNDPDFLNDIGLPSVSAKEQFENQYGEKRSINQLIRDGSRFEDDGTRAVNHFFDPYNDRPLTIYPFPNFRSPDWILSDIGVLDDQEYSMRYANEYFYSALTLQSEDQRNLKFGKLFETVGHMIHHIQDMAQPEHIRNDDHYDTVLCFFVFLCDPSLFEQHADKSFFEEYTDRSVIRRSDPHGGLALVVLDSQRQHESPTVKFVKCFLHSYFV
ncbi:MAG: hypothetical protein ACU843_13030 [Gammaproteobacteria bacterium]